MSENIEIGTEGGVLTLTFARPAKKNALTNAMYGELADALEKAAPDSAVRVVLFRGEGDMFTSGNDIGDFAAAAMGGEPPTNVLRFLRALSTFPKPVVAAVQGRAVGIGTTMLLHCDYVVLADDAKLSTPFVGLALVPEAASSLLLPARIGHARAFAMFALGESVAANDAVAWGLANRVVPLAGLAGAASEIVAKLVKLPLGSLVATKKLMKNAEATLAHMDVESAEFVARLATAEAREAFTAFAERRTPDFSKLG
ncbi:MAG TPA: enoyl-CoA hydratase [Polyangiaceae bacterium]